MCYNSNILKFSSDIICEVIMSKETVDGVDFKKEIKQDNSWFNANEFFVTVALVIVIIAVVFL